MRKWAEEKKVKRREMEKGKGCQNGGGKAGEKARETGGGGVEMGAGQVCVGCPHPPPVLSPASGWLCTRALVIGMQRN